MTDESEIDCVGSFDERGDEEQMVVKKLNLYLSGSVQKSGYPVERNNSNMMSF